MRVEKNLGLLSVIDFVAFSLKKGEALGGYCNCPGGNYGDDNSGGNDTWLDFEGILKVQLTLEQPGD